MKKILFTVLFTAMFSITAFAEPTIEKRDIQCWDMKSFVNEVFKPLKLRMLSEAIIDRFEDGRKKQTIDLLVAVEPGGRIYATIITEVTITPRYDDTNGFDQRVCVLARWLNTPPDVKQKKPGIQS
tara:strand:+ start:1153 stop:1530 length:378 start_codon:yes stop_codon:yes gene_type:complete